MTPQEVISLCRQEDVKSVDFRVVDILGHWHSFKIPVKKLDEQAFDQGLGFDGSRMPGWQDICQSDLRAIPQPETAYVELTGESRTLAISCNVIEPVSGEDYRRDPRNIAIQAANYLRATGIADAATFGPCLQYYVFDGVRYQQTTDQAFYFLGKRARSPSRGQRGRFSQSGFDAPVGSFGEATDATPIGAGGPPASLLTSLVRCGVDVASHRYEEDRHGPTHLDLQPNDLVRMADQIIRGKHVIRSHFAHRHQTATFMAQPRWQAPGCGMPTQLFLWKDGNPLFAGSQYAGLSELALHALGGILRHTPAIMAFTNPTTNSYKRLVRGNHAPTRLAYAKRNRSAACRIPMVSDDPLTKSIEFRCPDSSSNPYLAFAAILMAAIDGILNKISPGEPADWDINGPAPADLPEVQPLPATLEHALDALRVDHQFLLESSVFTPEVIQTWIELKFTTEVVPLRERPHPFEFELYL